MRTAFWRVFSYWENYPKRWESPPPERMTDEEMNDQEAFSLEIKRRRDVNMRRLSIMGLLVMLEGSNHRYSPIITYKSESEGYVTAEGTHSSQHSGTSH